jgi:hypothetical protein
MASQGVASMFAVAILFGVFASVPQSDTLSLFLSQYFQSIHLYLGKLKQSIYFSQSFCRACKTTSSSHFIVL